MEFLDRYKPLEIERLSHVCVSRTLRYAAPTVPPETLRYWDQFVVL